MRGYSKAESLRKGVHRLFKLVILKSHHLAALVADEMVVMVAARQSCLVASSAIADVESLQ